MAEALDTVESAVISSRPPTPRLTKTEQASAASPSSSPSSGHNRQQAIRYTPDGLRFPRPERLKGWATRVSPATVDLVLAVRDNDEDAVRAALRAGADVNIVVPEERRATILQLAANHPNPDCMVALLNHEVRPQRLVPDANGVTAMHACALHTESPLSLPLLVLAYGLTDSTATTTEVRLRVDQSGRTPLHCLMLNQVAPPHVINCVIEWLIRTQGDEFLEMLNYRTADGCSVLDLAAQRDPQRIHVVELSELQASLIALGAKSRPQLDFSHRERMTRDERSARVRLEELEAGRRYELTRLYAQDRRETAQREALQQRIALLDSSQAAAREEWLSAERQSRTELSQRMAHDYDRAVGTAAERRRHRGAARIQALWRGAKGRRVAQALRVERVRYVGAARILARVGRAFAARTALRRHKTDLLTALAVQRAAQAYISKRHVQALQWQQDHRRHLAAIELQSFIRRTLLVPGRIRGRLLRLLERVAEWCDDVEAGFERNAIRLQAWGRMITRRQTYLRLRTSAKVFQRHYRLHRQARVHRRGNILRLAADMITKKLKRVLFMNSIREYVTRHLRKRFRVKLEGTTRVASRLLFREAFLSFFYRHRSNFASVFLRPPEEESPWRAVLDRVLAGIAGALCIAELITFMIFARNADTVIATSVDRGVLGLLWLRVIMSPPSPGVAFDATCLLTSTVATIVQTPASFPVVPAFCVILTRIPLVLLRGIHEEMGCVANALLLSLKLLAVWLILALGALLAACQVIRRANPSGSLLSTDSNIGDLALRVYFVKQPYDVVSHHVALLDSANVTTTRENHLSSLLIERLPLLAMDLVFQIVLRFGITASFCGAIHIAFKAYYASRVSSLIVTHCGGSPAEARRCVEAAAAAIGGPSARADMLDHAARQRGTRQRDDDAESYDCTVEAPLVCHAAEERLAVEVTSSRGPTSSQHHEEGVLRRLIHTEWNGGCFARFGHLIVLLNVMLAFTLTESVADRTILEYSFSSFYAVELIVSLCIMTGPVLSQHPLEVGVRLFNILVGFVPKIQFLASLRAIRLLFGITVYWNPASVHAVALGYCCYSFIILLLVAVAALSQSASSNSQRAAVVCALENIILPPVVPTGVVLLDIGSAFFRTLLVPLSCAILAQPVLRLGEFALCLTRDATETRRRRLRNYAESFLESEAWYAAHRYRIKLKPTFIVAVQDLAHRARRRVAARKASSANGGTDTAAATKQHHVGSRLPVPFTFTTPQKDRPSVRNPMIAPLPHRTQSDLVHHVASDSRDEDTVTNVSSLDDPVLPYPSGSRSTANDDDGGNRPALKQRQLVESVAVASPCTCLVAPLLDAPLIQPPLVVLGRRIADTGLPPACYTTLFHRSRIPHWLNILLGLVSMGLLFWPDYVANSTTELAINVVHWASIPVALLLAPRDVTAVFLLFAMPCLVIGTVVTPQLAFLRFVSMLRVFAWQASGTRILYGAVRRMVIMAAKAAVVLVIAVLAATVGLAVSNGSAHYDPEDQLGSSFSGTAWILWTVAYWYLDPLFTSVAVFVGLAASSERFEPTAASLSQRLMVLLKRPSESIFGRRRQSPLKTRVEQFVRHVGLFVLVANLATICVVNNAEWGGLEWLELACVAVFFLHSCASISADWGLPLSAPSRPDAASTAAFASRLRQRRESSILALSEPRYSCRPERHAVELRAGFSAFLLLDLAISTFLVCAVVTADVLAVAPSSLYTVSLALRYLRLILLLPRDFIIGVIFNGALLGGTSLVLAVYFIAAGILSAESTLNTMALGMAQRLRFVSLVVATGSVSRVPEDPLGRFFSTEPAVVVCGVITRLALCVLIALLVVKSVPYWVLRLEGLTPRAQALYDFLVSGVEPPVDVPPPATAATAMERLPPPSSHIKAGLHQPTDQASQPRALSQALPRVLVGTNRTGCAWKEIAGRDYVPRWQVPFLLEGLRLVHVAHQRQYYRLLMAIADFLAALEEREHIVYQVQRSVEAMLAGGPAGDALPDRLPIFPNQTRPSLRLREGGSASDDDDRSTVSSRHQWRRRRVSRPNRSAHQRLRPTPGAAGDHVLYYDGVSVLRLVQALHILEKGFPASSGFGVRLWTMTVAAYRRIISATVIQSVYRMHHTIKKQEAVMDRTSRVHIQLLRHHFRRHQRCLRVRFFSSSTYGEALNTASLVYNNSGLHNDYCQRIRTRWEELHAPLLPAEPLQLDHMDNRAAVAVLREGQAAGSPMLADRYHNRDFRRASFAEDDGETSQGLEQRNFTATGEWGSDAVARRVSMHSFSDEDDNRGGQPPESHLARLAGKVAPLSLRDVHTPALPHPIMDGDQAVSTPVVIPSHRKTEEGPSRRSMKTLADVALHAAAQQGTSPQALRAVQADDGGSRAAAEQRTIPASAMRFHRAAVRGDSHYSPSSSNSDLGRE